MKRRVAESVPDRASSHTRNAAFEAVPPLEQDCSASLLKVESSVSDRFLKRSESSLNTLSEQNMQRNLILVNDRFKSKGSVANCMADMGLCAHLERCGTTSAPQGNINFCSHFTGATFETEQKPIRYSVNMA